MTNSFLNRIIDLHLPKFYSYEILKSNVNLYAVSASAVFGMAFYIPVWHQILGAG